MLTDPRRAFRFALAMLLGAVVLGAVVWSMAARAVLQHVDDGFLDVMESLRAEPFVSLAKALAFIGSGWVTWPVRVVVFAVLLRRRHWVHLSAFACAVVTSEVLIGGLKTLYDRPRPADGLLETASASFPSGHAVAAAVTAVGIVIVLFPPGHTRWVWERRAALYASMMALSRTYLGVHWLSDVVAGALLGSALAIGWPALFVLERPRLRSLRRPRSRGGVQS